MNLKSFERFQDGALSAGMVYFYTGSFDSEMVKFLANSLKDTLEQENASGPLKRKLFSSFIEMAQNILHYGGVPAYGASQQPGKPGAIGLGKSDQSYWIACGNLIPSEQVGRLSDKLTALQSMSIAEIKTAYRQQLANDEHESSDAVSKGAGLGLLTIARDSTQPIEFEFTPNEESAGRLSYFYLKAVI
jgi:hypothetical protein